jgi:P-type Ca2+ transporter type 2C
MLLIATAMLAQLFNTVNARSDEQSAFAHLFTNRWLWGAIGLSLVLQLLVLYAPPLQRAFGTVALSAGDWLRCLTAASMVLWLREASKLLARLGSRRRAGSAATGAGPRMRERPRMPAGL